MPCPFPGMDPYLEDPALWPAFHRQFVAFLDWTLLPGLTARYQAVIAQRCYTEAPGSGAGERQEDYVKVCQTGDGRLVTLVDVVSPANKTTEAGRQAYLDCRQRAKEAGASLVEIDLVLAGRPTLDYCREGLPDWNYAVTVTRSSTPDRYEIYTTTLAKRLPRFRLPLAGDDADRVFDLQAVLTRCHDEGGYANRIDYTRDPSAPLSEQDRLWLDETLTGKGLRKPRPPDEAVARAAYALWEEEGRPSGKDSEHWYEALARLRRPSPPDRRHEGG